VFSVSFSHYFHVTGVKTSRLFYHINHKAIDVAPHKYDKHNSNSHYKQWNQAPAFVTQKAF
ncbi:MAG: hypothetical protein WC341_10780, partial [Bacteroidales bacterium]